MKTQVKMLSLVVLMLMGTITLIGCSGGGNGSEPLSTAKAITAFSITNPAATGTIDENAKTISITVPYGTNVTVLVATFITTGTSVKVGAMVQVSGTTLNYFTSPVAYTVTAVDGTTATYTVTVTMASSTAKALTAFSFRNPAATGTINENAKTISITVPYGTADVTNLVATFFTTGVNIAVGTTAQVSGTTPNDFTNPVAYTVTAADGTTATYTVTVTVAPSSSKSITSFSVLGISGTINGSANPKTIYVTVPVGTPLTGLVPTFTSTGASVTVGGINQVSGTTPNDFTNPVDYTVIAADGSMETYRVTVTITPAITAFSFTSPAAIGTINDVAKTITVKVPVGTNVSALIATFTATGASVKVNTTVQASGTTQNNFTNPVVYTVTAANGKTATYTVTVTMAPAITAFSFTSPAATATIDENAKTIAITVSYGTNVTDIQVLVATYTTTNTVTSVTVKGIVQQSGATQNDFTNPVMYTVTASDGTTATYTVTVTVALNPAKAITAFSFTSPAATGVINENAKTIAITVPSGTVVTNVVATFITTGDSVAVGTTPQVSGTTPNDFTTPVAYIVTAADGSTTTYSVFVTFPIAWQATSGGHLDSGVGGGTLTWSHTTSPGNGKILIVSAMMYRSTGGTIKTATYSGNQLTLIKDISAPSSERVSMWYMLEPPVGTYDVVITYTGNHLGLEGASSTYTGVSQNRPYSNYAVNSATSSAGPATVTVSSAPGELVVDALGYQNGGSITPDGTQTQRYNQNDTSQTGGVSEKQGASSVTMSWTLQNPGTWAIIAVGLRPSASPIVRTVTVKPSGGDYPSLQAALTGEAADLVWLNRQLNIECYSMSDTIAVNIPDAFITDPDHYIKIYTPASERHQGTWNNTKYRLEITAVPVSSFNYPACIWLKGRHVWFDGIQVKCSASCTNYPSIFIVDNLLSNPLPLSAVTMRFSNNILVGNFAGGTVSNSNAWVNIWATAPSDSLFYLWNTEVRDIACQNPPSLSCRIIHIAVPSYETWFIDSVTLYNAYQALAPISLTTFQVRNSIAAGLLPGGTSWSTSKANAESDYNTSSNAETLQGGHSKSLVTPLFVDIPNRDLRLQAADTVARDSGLNTLNNPLVNGGVDGKGSIRDSIWDIGAYEY